MSFYLNVISNIPLFADLHQLHAWQHVINGKQQQSTNLQCQTIDYTPSDEILILPDNSTTQKTVELAPFSITQVYTNGTFTSQCTLHLF